MHFDYRGRSQLNAQRVSSPGRGVGFSQDTWLLRPLMDTCSFPAVESYVPPGKLRPFRLENIPEKDRDETTRRKLVEDIPTAGTW